ncbi:MAG: 30S ribosomal protein S20, partial [Candidatus Obscuribacterales bacterium]|nr:30S ribosomal protein S20 [Candidatus Obscuribacterales bacterium]
METHYLQYIRSWEFLAVPKIKSAIKRVEVAERNREKNRSWKSAVRTARTHVEDSVKEDDAKA